MLAVSDNKKIGMFMLGLGAFFMFLGVLFFFDRALLALGDVLFLGGFPFLIGVKRSLTLFNPFARRARWKGILAFFLGFFLVVTGWPVIGFGLQAFGVLNMFGGFLGTIVGQLRHMPVIGAVFNNAAVNGVVNKLLGKERSSMV